MRKLESLILPGPAGPLEALLEEPEHGAPVQAWVICHPHPLYGGTMHNKVVYRIARGLRTAGAVVLRFNFRGVGKSAGIHDNGRGETEDARTALDFMRSRYPVLPVSLAGFSFGSRIAARLGCMLPGGARILACGFPTRLGIPPGLDNCTADKIIVQSTHDQFGPRAELERVFAALRDPKRLIWVNAQDHFFAGSLDRFEEVVRAIGGESAPGE